MKKFEITPEELQQSLEKLNDSFLNQLNDSLCQATVDSISNREEENIFTPLHDLFDSLWSAVIDEKIRRCAARISDKNLYIKRL